MPHTLIQVTILIIVHFVISLLLTRLSIPCAYKLKIVDKRIPDSNGDLIIKPLPRCGGIGIIVSFLLFLFLNNSLYHIFPGSIFPRDTFFFTIIALTLLLVLGLVDDRFGLGAGIKLPVQICVSILMLSGGFIIVLPLLPDPTLNLYLNRIITIFWFIVVINSFNIIDGLDGLAGGTATIVIFFLIVFDLLILHTFHYPQLLVLISCICGFMILNRHPAKTFLGDTGSTFLGAIIAIYTLKMEIAGRVSLMLLIPIILLLYPFLDTGLAVTRRTQKYITMKNIESNGISLKQYLKFVFTGDREHIHHQMLKMNRSHRKTVRILLIVNAALGILSIILFFSNIVIKFIVLLLLFIAIAFFLLNLGYLPSNKTMNDLKDNFKKLLHWVFLLKD